MVLNQKFVSAKIVQIANFLQRLLTQYPYEKQEVDFPQIRDGSFFVSILC